MTVQELRDLLDGIPGNLPVYIHEDGSLGTDAEAGRREDVTDDLGEARDVFAIYVVDSYMPFVD